MSFRSRLFGEDIVQVSSADYCDGETVTPIKFVLIEDRWGRRKYHVTAPAGISLGEQDFAQFDGPVLAWMQGGPLPPDHLSDPQAASPRIRPPSRRYWASETTDLLSRAERERLSKVLEMLNSEHDGEIVNAARAAAAFLKTRNLNWHDALGVAGGD